jgi:hypothetical protein
MTFTPDDDPCQFAERRHPDASSIKILPRKTAL